MNKEDFVREACAAHSNLNVWAAVVALLEGGMFYGASVNYYAAQQAVIKRAKREQRKLLKQYDRATANALKAKL